MLDLLPFFSIHKYNTEKMAIQTAEVCKGFSAPDEENNPLSQSAKWRDLNSQIAEHRERYSQLPILTFSHILSLS